MLKSQKFYTFCKGKNKKIWLPSATYYNENMQPFKLSSAVRLHTNNMILKDTKKSFLNYMI